MVEGSSQSWDTAIYIHEGGDKNLVPVQLNDPAQANSATEPDLPVTDPDVYSGIQEPADMEQNFESRNLRTRKGSFYMREFVARVDGILQALQAQEALPSRTICAKCSKFLGHWRCEDCIGGTLLCRFCMRHSHFSNPFHRIVYWTGTHFRKAALWEVGVYLTLPHQYGAICPNLVWQRQMLEKVQKIKDDVESNSTEELKEMDRGETAESAPDPEREAYHDKIAMEFMDQLFAGHNPDDLMEEDDEEDLVDTEADVQDIDAGMAGFTNYMNERLGPESHMHSHTDTPNAPNCDALNNQYIRAVHTNGIHHIALVFCTCQGHDAITTDLIYAGWVPTSFVQVRTIFTCAVLDHFRYCNLEMRSSAYQFFQLLRRITNPLTPSKVVNLYHELRRLSRLWRWVKKLRWAGYGQRVGQQITPKTGELGNFCPACPQVGINLPEHWKDDPNRWVFRRVLTADGNFKADHVRQKSAAGDVWLSDGLGMTTRNSDYKSFLETAWDRKTVSVNELHLISVV